jgi:hypothetical protein
VEKITEKAAEQKFKTSKNQKGKDRLLERWDL